MPILNTKIRAERRDGNGNVIPISSQQTLLQEGPKLQLTLSQIPEQAKAIADKGERVPAPISGYALVDTGASVTCIDRATADRAGLAVVDRGQVASATHEAETVPIYAGKFDILGLASIVTYKAYGANLASQKLIALIGRDVLKSCVLIYNGTDGSFSLSL